MKSYVEYLSFKHTFSLVTGDGVRGKHDLNKSHPSRALGGLHGGYAEVMVVLDFLKVLRG